MRTNGMLMKIIWNFSGKFLSNYNYLRICLRLKTWILPNISFSRFTGSYDNLDTQKKFICTYVSGSFCVQNLSRVYWGSLMDELFHNFLILSDYVHARAWVILIDNRSLSKLAFSFRLRFILKLFLATLKKICVSVFKMANRH